MNVSNNKMLTKDAGKALGDMLKANSVLKELNVSSNYDYLASATDGAGFATAIADGIGTSRALRSLNISNNQMATKEAGKAFAEALAANSSLKELDVSSNTDDGRGDGIAFDGADGPGFAQEFAAGVADNRALTSLNISNNSLCGITDHGGGVTSGTFDASGIGLSLLQVLSIFA